MPRSKAKRDLRAPRDEEEAAVLPISLIEASLLSIAQRLDFTGINAADYKRINAVDYIGVVEGLAHELSHFLDLGAHFESALNGMEDAEANTREASTLRIEVAALAALGVRVSMRRLLATANWRGDAGRPSLARLQVPLSRRERRRVGRFITMVRTESAGAQVGT